MGTISEIENKIIDTLRAEMPQLRTVEPYDGQLEGNSPLRFPAAFTIYGGSEYKWLRGTAHEESVTFSVIVVDKDISGIRDIRDIRDIGGAYGMAEDVIEALANNALGLSIEDLRPLKVSAVKTGKTIEAYRIDFGTGFERATGLPATGPSSEDSSLKCCSINILETSTVTLSAGAEDPAYPLYRLYDRNIGRPFKTTSAVTTEIKIDQGGAAAPKSADRLIIPAGHNLSGMTMDIKFSDDDVLYTAAVPQWLQSDSGLIEKSWAATGRRYWKFIVEAPSAAPELPEIFLTSTYVWEKQPSRPRSTWIVFNVEDKPSSGGQDRFLIHGEPKRRRVYRLERCGTVQKNNLTALNDEWLGARPFYLFDHEGNWIFGKLEKPLEMEEVSYETYGFEFEYIEVLP